MTKEELISKRAKNVQSTLCARGLKGVPIALIRQAIREVIGTPCRYCGVRLTVSIIGADHKISVQHGGDKLGFENIDFGLCMACNRAKGSFNADCFADLLGTAEGYGERKTLLSRLKGANLIFRRGRPGMIEVRGRFR